MSKPAQAPEPAPTGGAHPDEAAPAKPSPLARLREKLAHLRAKAGFTRTIPLGGLEKTFVALVLGAMLLGTVSIAFIGVTVTRGLKQQWAARAAIPSAGHAPEKLAHGGHGEHGEVADGAHSPDEDDAAAEGDDHDLEEHAADDAGDHGEAHAESGGHGGEASIITQELLPKEITDRQDGKIDGGQDLVEPEITKTRGLAAILKSDLTVEGPPKYVNLSEVIAATRGGDKGDGVVIGDLVLVLTDFEAMEEVNSKMTQLRALVGSLIADQTREDLRTFKGKAAFKAAVQREINHQLTKGQVKDVLFSKFLVR